MLEGKYPRDWRILGSDVRHKMTRYSSGEGSQHSGSPYLRFSVGDKDDVPVYRYSTQLNDSIHCVDSRQLIRDPMYGLASSCRCRNTMHLEHKLTHTHMRAPIQWAMPLTRGSGSTHLVWSSNRSCPSQYSHTCNRNKKKNGETGGRSSYFKHNSIAPVTTFMANLATELPLRYLHNYCDWVHKGSQNTTKLF